MKDRLDKLLVEQGLCPSRAQAQGLILAGKVKLQGKVLDKPGMLVDPVDVSNVLLEEPLPYVSRGGLKLEKALADFQIDVTDRVCFDIGASTGGFTDCLLQQGARRVVAVDVGYGQLDWKLRQDPRVVVLEKTNIRHLSPQLFLERGSLATVDVSFISLTKVLPAVTQFLTAPPVPEVVALLKPQFEYRDYFPEKGFKGVVHGEASHQTILQGVMETLHSQLPQWQLVGLSFSPVLGPKGNREFLLHLQYTEAVVPFDADALARQIQAVVMACYGAL